MGRRKIREERGVSLDDIRSLYRQLESVKGVARSIGVSYRTAKKYLREAGVQPRRGRPPVEEGGKHFSAFANWLRKHPQTALPRSISAISKITGFSKDTIKSYLRRRRRRVQKFVESLPPLGEKNRLLLDIEGRRIPTRGMDWYILSIDRWTLKIKIRALMKNQRPYFFEYTMEELKRVLEASPESPTSPG